MKRMPIFLLLFLAAGASIWLYGHWRAGGFSPFAPAAGSKNTPRAEQAPEPPREPAMTEAGSKAMEIFEQGLQAYNSRRFDEAVGYFDRALQLDPNCYPALSYKGAALAFKGDYRGAVQLLDRAIALKTDCDGAYFNKALALELAGKYDQALDCYDRALAINPRNPWSYYGKASIYGRLKNVGACVENLQKAIDIDPSTREHARTEADFNNVRNAPEFQRLVYR
ncbi:MAG TPA: tetratricopeptide repeat protein [Desulfotomaculum sp.]|nr:tetratricopeptide repeat protein [Desulfotomaculum sp.]